MRTTFTVAHELDVNIDTMLKDVNEHINDVIVDGLVANNAIIDFFEKQDTDRLLNEVVPKIKKILIDKLAQM